MMKMQIPSRYLEIISAYLDGELTNHQRLRFKARLRKEPHLKDALEEMRMTRELLRATPPLKAPRNFFLKAEAVGQPRLSFLKNFYLFRMATAIASFLLILVLVGDFIGISGQLTGTGVGSQVVSINKIQEVEAPYSESLEVEILGEEVAATRDVPAEMAPSEVYLEAAPGLEEEEQTTAEVDSNIPNEMPEADGELLSEGEHKGRDVDDDIGAEYVPQWEDEPLMQEAPPPDNISPIETDYVEEGEVLPTALEEIALDIMEQQPGLGDGEMDNQPLQGNMDTEAVAEREYLTWEPRKLLRFIEFLLGIIVILSGILTVYFRKVSRDAG